MADNTDNMILLVNVLSQTIFDWCRQNNYPQHMGVVALKVMLMGAYDKLPATTLCMVDQAAHVIYKSTDKQLIQEPE